MPLDSYWWKPGFVDKEVHGVAFPGGLTDLNKKPPPPVRVAQPSAGPQPVREGLRVKIEPIAGITKSGLINPFGVYFQCPPLEEFAVDFAHTHTDYETVTAGQFSRKGGRQLTTVTFDTLVVDWGLYTILNAEVEAEEFSAFLRELCLSGSPFLFTAAHQMPPGGYKNWSKTLGGPELQMAATLRTLRVSEKAGEGDARYLNCSFTEYRDPAVHARKLGGGGGKGPKALPVTGGIQAGSGFFVYKPKGGATVTVKGALRTTGGDRVPYAVSLADLARHFYGDPSWAQRIAQSNGLKSWGNSSALVLHPRWKHGGKLRIPNKKGESFKPQKTKRDGKIRIP